MVTRWGGVTRTVQEVLLGFAVINGVNLVLAFVATLFAWGFIATFEIVSLLEAGALLIVAGGMDFSASIFPSKIRQHIFKSGKEWSPKEHRQAQKGAVKYLLMGALLLLESLALPVLLR